MVVTEHESETMFFLKLVWQLTKSRSCFVSSVLPFLRHEFQSQLISVWNLDSEGEHEHCGSSRGKEGCSSGSNIPSLDHGCSVEGGGFVSNVKVRGISVFRFIDTEPGESRRLALSFGCLPAGLPSGAEVFSSSFNFAIEWLEPSLVLTRFGGRVLERSSIICLEFSDERSYVSDGTISNSGIPLSLTESPSIDTVRGSIF